MDVQTKISESVTAPHALEIDAGGVRPCSDIWYIDTGKKTSLDNTLQNWLSSFLEGVGQAHLVELKVHAHGPEGSKLYVGVSSVGKTETAKTLANTNRGFLLVPNSRTANGKAEAVIVPMATISRQIQPASSNQPMMRLVYEKTADMNCTFEFRVQIPDVRVRDTTLA